MNAGILILYGLLGVLGLYALARRDASLRAAVIRAIEQAFKLLPRLLCALVAAGFIAKLIPSEVISTYLGGRAGVGAVLLGALVGTIVPAGPVVAFSIAAVFAKAGASAPALVAFITSWSVFAAHRIVIYEIPLLGAWFLRMRLIAVAPTPILAGLFSMAVGAAAGVVGL